MKDIPLFRRGGFHIRPKNRGYIAKLHIYSVGARLALARKSRLFFIGCVRQWREHIRYAKCATSPLEMVPTEAKPKHNLIKITISKAYVFSGGGKPLPYRCKGYRLPLWDAHTGAPLQEKKGGRSSLRADMESAPTML